MKKEVVLSGKVKQKLVNKTSEDYNLYVPLEGELVIIKDGENLSIVVGDGANIVNKCKEISGTGDLSDYVQFTDTATTLKAGVIQFQSNYGLSQYSGKIKVVETNQDGITNKSAQGQSDYGVVTSNNYDLLPFAKLATLSANPAETTPVGFNTGTIVVCNYSNGQDESTTEVIVILSSDGDYATLGKHTNL